MPIAWASQCSCACCASPVRPCCPIPPCQYPCCNRSDGNCASTHRAGRNAERKETRRIYDALAKPLSEIDRRRCDDRLHQTALAEAGDDRQRNRPALLRTVRPVGTTEFSLSQMNSPPRISTGVIARPADATAACAHFDRLLAVSMALPAARNNSSHGAYARAWLRHRAVKALR